MILSNVGWLGEGDGWPHGRMFPWVETDGQTTPASATTQSSNGHPPHRIPTINDRKKPRHNADVSVASLLVLGHQLLLDPQPHPGARAGLVGQVSFSGSGSQDDVFFDRDASLHCDFDTQGEELYSVKWYKVSLLVYFGS